MHLVGLSMKKDERINSGGFLDADRVYKACDEYTQYRKKLREHKLREFYDNIKTVKEGFLWNRREVVLDDDEAYKRYCDNNMWGGLEKARITEMSKNEKIAKNLMGIAKHVKYDMFVSAEDFEIIREYYR